MYLCLLLAQVAKLKESEREDIKLMSTSYTAVLEAGMNSMIAEPEDRAAASKKSVRTKWQTAEGGEKWMRSKVLQRKLGHLFCVKS